MRLNVSLEAQRDLFRKHRKRIAEFDDSRETLPKLKVAILSGVTIHPLRGILEAVLLEDGVDPSFFEGGYNCWEFDARFSQELVDFVPDVVYFHQAIDNLVELPEIAMQEDEARARINAIWLGLKQAIESVLNRTSATVIINTFEFQNFRVNGNFEAVAVGGAVRAVSDINRRLADFARDNRRVLLNDVAWLSAKVGLENWYDAKSFAAFKQPFTARAQTEIALSLAALIRVNRGLAAKGLVLDLDNTLWGGVIGDDGVDGVKIGQGNATAEAYLKFQRAIRPLLGRGIAFAVCSKNEEEIARAGLNRADMILKEEDFHVLKINWNPKSKNISEIRDALNVGMDSLVFIDDSAFERAEVRAALPELNVPEVAADPLQYLQALSHSYAFETSTISDDDRRRGETFKAMIEFSDAQETHDIEAFLKSQGMSYEISPLTDANAERVHQLINKTNQFNLTTQRMTVPEVDAYRTKGVFLAVSLHDKSTSYGLVSALWGDIQGGDFTLSNWVMSCRVFNRRLEHVVFLQLSRQLRERGVDRVLARYVPSAKNKPVAGLLPSFGMMEVGRDGDAVLYECQLPSPSSDELAKFEELYS